MDMNIGTFVISKSNTLGIGKIIYLNESTATVEYFYSINRQETQEVTLFDLKPVPIEKQTRCYIQEKSTGIWRIGRIVKNWEQEYEIDFPDANSSFLHGSDLYVRCNQSPEDPINVLQGKGHETAFFYNHRRTFVESMMEQRSYARGMTGLISSSIELLSHQVEVIRRVLEDPIPRYLLADEVGLGKTIEAGVIARQYLIDHKDSKVLFIVPMFLHNQWQLELEQKCTFYQFKGRFLISSLPIDQSLIKQGWGMVVIDEAHEVSRLAFATQSEEYQQYLYLTSVCHSAEGLLLLSATPVLTNEREYLSMLHLLDPDNFKLNQVDAFRDRVLRRQEVGRILVSLREETRPFLLRRSLGRLQEAFPSDRFIQEWAGQLLEMLDGEHDEDERAQLIRKLRIHISETYRLHRRLLRNRRETLRDMMPFGRDVKGKDVLCRSEYDLTDQAEQLQRLLEEWRYEAWASERHYWDQQPMPAASALSQVFQILWECIGTDFQYASEVLKSRLTGEVTFVLENGLSSLDVQVLTRTPMFEGEMALIQQMLDTVVYIHEDGDRIDLLGEILKQRIRKAIKKGQQPPKIVIFTSFTNVAGNIANRLKPILGTNAVATYHSQMYATEIEQEVLRFSDKQECSVLICDRSGETGRNLQFADHVIHFDLPLSPNRIEQRIGRLDRIGRTKPFEMTVLRGPECEDSYQDLWGQFVDEVLNVFGSSISSLQFLIDAIVPRLLRTAFTEGPSGLREAMEEVEASLLEEKGKIDEQNMLDEMDATDSVSIEFFQELVRFDQQYADIRGSMEPWIVGALRYDKKLVGSEDVFTYNAIRNKTLVPLRFMLPLHETMECAGSYSRQIATQFAGTRLYRLGDPFVDMLNEYIHWDDRGKTYAIWRQVPNMDAREGSEWKGFVFHFCIEGDIDEAVSLWNRNQSKSFQSLALQRRMDMYFPPMSKTIVLTIEGEIEQNPDIVDQVTRRFIKKEEGGRDVNLTKDRNTLIDHLVSHSYWTYACQNSRKEAEMMLRNSPNFQQLCQERYRVTRGMTDQVMTMLRIREHHHQGQHILAGDINLEFEQMLAYSYLNGVTTPKITLDSVGFVVLSGEDAETRLRRNSVGKSAPSA